MIILEKEIYQVDAFTDIPFGGNPAGVMPNAQGLNENDMQKIASEMNLSETAFIKKIGKNVYDVRFFTPSCEVDLCGHATIASFYTLAYKQYIESENDIMKAYQNTKAGRLGVEIQYKDGKVEKVMMEQGEPRSKGKIVQDIEKLCNYLNIDTEEIGIEEMKAYPEIISTGLPDIILPVKNKDILDKIVVDMDGIANFSNELGVTGVHAFTLYDSDKIYCRNFAPAVGIDEEAATGTANGATLYYLKKNNFIGGNKIVSIQGYNMGRPSKINCEITQEKQRYTVKVGGRANIVIEGTIKL